ncbi:divalent-cation tolerance protein CutA [Archaeoglobus veneficus]|uniref:CutA1 divalent ion tolerance protein n=1 Tax=Archaeoglobus veneficus (strain DSM 11195 / SNP6) TaxID=693661 RepID=F2KQG5_ARCVS|nr:divalent-cation tolerance protein CutA [Archaeoglobus veneficus]AEA47698.1 CutA1 divalent ion tolerance protein [Archaeoglobus veneficus SNP6]
MYVFVYVTASSLEEARKIARHVLEKKLAACVNVFPISSMFWWEGRIENALEFAMIIKTKSEKLSELKEEIKSLHSYSTPCICAFAVEDGLREFLNWIDETVEEE